MASFSQDHKASDGRSSVTGGDLRIRSVPSNVIVGVEHPGIVKDLDRGIQTLGGESRLRELVENDSSDGNAKLYLRPQDRTCKPIHSTNVKTHNVVLEITVPKRTGGRRKKGSAEPYRYVQVDPDGSEAIRPNPHRTDSRYLLRSLQDNDTNFSVQAAGLVEHTHRFRNMPDFVYSTTNSAFMSKLRENILPFDYHKMKNFRFDMSRGPKVDTEILPPPSLTAHYIPFNYSYRQNPAVKQFVDPLGNVTVANIQKADKIMTQLVTYDVDTVPQGPTDDVPNLGLLDPTIQRLIPIAQNLMQERPIWTRRALANALAGHEGIVATKHVYQYVGYMFRSGPWRDTVVKFGVDPRKDPKHRIYQTLFFKAFDWQQGGKISQSQRAAGRPQRGSRRVANVLNRETHIFDGNSVSLDGKMWQICDIVDPLLKAILATDEIRETCHIRYGWYQNGTWAKAKVIMRHRIAQLRAGEISNDTDYINIGKLPHIYNDANRHVAIIKKGEGSEGERLMAMEYRSLAAHYLEKDDGSNDEQAKDGEQAMSEQDGEEPPLDPKIAWTLSEPEEIATKKRRLGGDDGFEETLDNDVLNSVVEKSDWKPLYENDMECPDQDGKDL